MAVTIGCAVGWLHADTNHRLGYYLTFTRAGTLGESPRLLLSIGGHYSGEEEPRVHAASLRAGLHGLFATEGFYETALAGGGILRFARNTAAGPDECPYQIEVWPTADDAIVIPIGEWQLRLVRMLLEKHFELVGAVTIASPAATVSSV